MSFGKSSPDHLVRRRPALRYGHLYGSDVEAVGVAINTLLTRNCGQNVVKGTDSEAADLNLRVPELRASLWSLGDSNS